MSFRSIERGFPNSFALSITSYISSSLSEALGPDSPWSAAAAAVCPPLWAHAGQESGSNRPKYFKEQRMIPVTDMGFSEWLCDWLRIHVSRSKISDLTGPRDAKKVSRRYETTSEGRGCSQGNQRHTEDKVRDSLSLVNFWPKPFSLKVLKSETAAAPTSPWTNRNGQSRAHLLYASGKEKKFYTQIKCYKDKVMRILCFHQNL